MRSLAIVFCMSVIVLLCPSRAEAYSTVCDLRDAIRFGYGTKINAVVWVPRERGDAFRSGVEAFFGQPGYSVWTVSSSGAPRGNSAPWIQIPRSDDREPAFWNQIPQSTSNGIGFHIETRSDQDFAIVELTTFSFDCRATEAWRPHWYRFRDYLLASEFRPVFSWQPLIPQVARKAGGEFSVPLWFVFLRSQVYLFAPWLQR